MGVLVFEDSFANSPDDVGTTFVDFAHNNWLVDTAPISRAACAVGELPSWASRFNMPKFLRNLSFLGGVGDKFDGAP
jgi:hypothetical protein